MSADDTFSLPAQALQELLVLLIPLSEHKIISIFILSALI